MLGEMGAKVEDVTGVSLATRGLEEEEEEGRLAVGGGLLGQIAMGGHG